jgi:putative DNA primase/helicase
MTDGANGKSHPEIGRILSETFLHMRATTDVVSHLKSIQDCAIRLAPFNDSEAFDRLHAMAVDVHGLGTDDVMIALTGGLEKARRQPQLARDLGKHPRFMPLGLGDFIGLEVQTREMLLNPILPAKGLAMIYAYRGVGKTHAAMGMAYAVASGGTFLRWKAPTPKGVLYVDGEMPASELQKRFREIIAGQPTKPTPGALKILAADLVDGGLGNLADRKVQARIDDCLDGTDLLVLDNLSSLCSMVRDNDAESWQTIQEWLLRMRRRGVSVLLVHHAGKDGEQRGTSRKEDVLDTSIALKRPKDYVPTEGARFEIHLEKARGVHGEGAKPFEVRLDVRCGAAQWTIRDIEDVNMARVMELAEQGYTEREIADLTGIPKSTVNRLKQQAKAKAAEQPSLDIVN